MSFSDRVVLCLEVVDAPLFAVMVGSQCDRRSARANIWYMSDRDLAQPVDDFVQNNTYT